MGERGKKTDNFKSAVKSSRNFLGRIFILGAAESALKNSHIHTCTHWINGFDPRHAYLTVLLYLKLNDSVRNTTLGKKCNIYPLLGSS